MNDLIRMEIKYAGGDLRCPIDESRSGHFSTTTKHLIELALGAELHDDAEAGSLCTDAPDNQGQVHDGETHRKRMMFLW